MVPRPAARTSSGQWRSSVVARGCGPGRGLELAGLRSMDVCDDKTPSPPRLRTNDVPATVFSCDLRRRAALRQLTDIGRRAHSSAKAPGSTAETVRAGARTQRVVHGRSPRPTARFTQTHLVPVLRRSPQRVTTSTTNLRATGAPPDGRRDRGAALTSRRSRERCTMFAIGDGLHLPTRKWPAWAGMQAAAHAEEKGEHPS